MKWLLIILLIGLVFLIGSQVWAGSQVSDIETYSYDVIEDYDAFEIRRYEKANFIYAKMDAKSYQEASGQGFNTLAGYIFGGNSENKSIAMTSPVEVEMGEQMSMRFMVPAEYDINKMPTPDNAEVEFITEQERTMAAISFGGFANDEKIEEYKQKLTALLAEKGIKHSGDFSFMGFDPPFKLYDRRNEVVVEVMGY